MSDMSVGSVGEQTRLPIPPIPHRSHPFREAIPTDPTRSHGSGEPIPNPIPRDGIGGSPSPTGVNRKPQIRVHPCHQPILAGLDANRCALSVAVDPYPLTPMGEVWALQSGRRTYALLWGALERRDAWTIPGHPPSPGLPVMAEHVCESPIPMEHRAPPTPPRPTPADKEPF